MENPDKQKHGFVLGVFSMNGDGIIHNVYINSINISSMHGQKNLWNISSPWLVKEIAQDPVIEM